MTDPLTRDDPDNEHELSGSQLLGLLSDAPDDEEETPSRDVHGFEVIEKLRGAKSPVPIIVLSSRADEEGTQRASANGQTEDTQGSAAHLLARRQHDEDRLHGPEP